MWIFVAAVVAVAIGALVVAALMRPGGDDASSVRSYHSALGTLEHLSHPERRVRRPASRGGPGVSDPPGDPLRASAPSAEAQENDESLDPAGPLVFDDARPRDRYRPPPPGPGPAKARRAQRIALDSMNHRQRRGGGWVLVAVALVVFAALAYVGSRRSPSPSHVGASATTHARSATSTTLHPSQAGHRPARSRTSTTTTTPSQIVASTSSSTGTTATYPVGTATFTLEIVASGPCWVDVTTAATGATLWTGTLQAGGTQSVSATGATTVELGATGAALSVDGTPVVFPTTMHTPFVATFQTSTSATSTAPTTPAASPSTTAPSTSSTG
jgi:hypothetical protein